MFHKNIRDTINEIDVIWYDNDEITKEQGEKLADSLGILLAEYNKAIQNYKNSLSDLQPHDIRAAKQSFINLEISFLFTMKEFYL
jgi:hypothetical protein